MPQNNLATEKQKVIDMFKPLFKDENGNQLVFTPRQHEIINEIGTQRHNRVVVCAPTQYGKSTAVGCGIIIPAVCKAEKHVIIGGTQAKANIIMSQVITHLFDDPIFTSQLEIGGSLEKLRRERRGDKITFRRGGSVVCISAENRNKRRVGESLLGEGGKNIYIDDSVLMDNDTYSYIKRMVGGHKENFILEAANPLKRNHFFKTLTQDKKYYKIYFDYKEALKEGRFTPEFIEEMRKELFFDVFYECKFPDGNIVDEKGWELLLTDKELEEAVSSISIDPKAKGKKAGIDVGRGGNKTVVAVREGSKAIIQESVKTPELMSVVGMAIRTSEEFSIAMGDIAVDDTGIGGGVTSRLREQKYFINPFIAGGKAGVIKGSKLKYKNKRAEVYWSLRVWIKEGGKINNNEALIEQLRHIKFKINSSGEIQIQPKEEMVISGYDSPDEADALSMTFATKSIGTMTNDFMQKDKALAEFEEIGLSMRDLDNFSMKNL